MGSRIRFLIFSNKKFIFYFKGNINNGLSPEYLISLTLPKAGAKQFKGKHLLGGLKENPKIASTTI